LARRYSSTAEGPQALTGWVGAPRAQAHLLAAVVEYRTPHKRVKHGLATGWLARLQAHPTLPQARPARRRLRALHGAPLAARGQAARLCLHAAGPRAAALRPAIRAPSSLPFCSFEG